MTILRIYCSHVQDRRGCPRQARVPPGESWEDRSTWAGTFIHILSL